MGSNPPDSIMNVDPKVVYSVGYRDALIGVIALFRLKDGDALETLKEIVNQCSKPESISKENVHVRWAKEYFKN